MRPVTTVLLALSLRAQNVLPPDLEALAKIRTRMLFNLEHQPNYTCVETIERSSRSKTSNKFKVIDTLRLEVALADGREMFAWPGSKKFDETDVTQFVTSGAIGNGEFGTHARALFTTRIANFHYRGLVDFQNRKAIRFDYDVPQMLSGYRIRVSNSSAIVGYRGSFYADPTTFDMQRIEVRVDDPPPALLLTSASDIIDYDVARIGEGDFLLPSESLLSMIAVTGGEEQNHVRFTACRQYSGESVISFADAPVGDDAPAKQPETTALREFDMPAGLDVALVLTKDFDLKTIAIGDPVAVRVDRDVKQKGQIVIPKGATATGRVTRLERHDNYTALGVEFPEIEAPGILALMVGNLSNTVGVLPIPLRRAVSTRTLRRPGEGIIFITATQLRLAHGCIIVWRT